VSVTIQGADEVQKALRAAAQVAKQGGALQQAVGAAANHLHAYAVNVTHVDTGALRASHIIRQSGARALIYPSPAVRNPRSGKSPAEYGIYEERRGGSHAFYARAMGQARQAVDAAEAHLRRGLP